MVNFKILGSSCNHSTAPFVPYTLIFRPFSPPVAAEDTHIDPLALLFNLTIIKALSSTDISSDKELTSAEVNSLSDEISVDDNAFMIVRLNNKARGSIWVSSAATGGENGLKIRVYGTKGAVEWLQDDPNILKFTKLNSSTQIITRE